jgi:hypothetical protein
MFDRVGVYWRLNWMENNAPAYVITETLTDWTAGVDYNWRWFRTGAEYEDYNSNFSQYTAYRFFQDLNFQLDRRSSLGFNFNETFYHYNNSQTGENRLYQFTSRYNVQLWSSLSCYLQGSALWQDITDSSQMGGSAQAGLNWTYGKLYVRAGYEYNTLSTTSGMFTEDRTKNRLFLYLKRTF